MREMRIMMTVLVRRAWGSLGGKRSAGRLVRFAADRSGNVTMMFGLTAIALFVAIGGAIDFSR
ncbi:MAG: TadE/TadG family type IV pilus assembly protein [Hyphomicrobium sp.]